jgi:hypothetical protein
MRTGANERLPVDNNCGEIIEIRREHLLNTHVLDVHRKDGLCFSKGDKNLVTCVDGENKCMKFFVGIPSNFLL